MVSRGDRKTLGGPWAEVGSYVSIRQGTGQALRNERWAARALASSGKTAVLGVRMPWRARTCSLGPPQRPAVPAWAWCWPSGSSREVPPRPCPFCPAGLAPDLDISTWHYTDHVSRPPPGPPGAPLSPDLSVPSECRSLGLRGSPGRGPFCRQAALGRRAHIFSWATTSSDICRSGFPRYHPLSAPVCFREERALQAPGRGAQHPSFQNAADLPEPLPQAAHRSEEGNPARGEVGVSIPPMLPGLRSTWMPHRSPGLPATPPLGTPLSTPSRLGLCSGVCPAQALLCDRREQLGPSL